MALPPVRLKISDLTTEIPDGAGMFDVMMKSIKNHIQEEYEENRITGEEYTKAYIELTTAALSSAMQFLTQRETLYYQSELLQAQRDQTAAQTSLTEYQINNILPVELAKLNKDVEYTEAQRLMTLSQTDQVEQTTVGIVYRNTDILPVELAKLNKDVETTEAQRVLTLSNKSIADYNLSDVLPANVHQTEKQTNQIEQTTAGITYRNTDILPEEKRQLIYQTDHVMRSNVEKLEFEVSAILPQQRDNLIKDAAIKDYQLSNTLVQQLELLKEQTEVQHAQTKDIRIDGTDVVGAVGKQKDLYSQQIDSYKKDARYKVGKMYLDSWITQKSLDEGLNAPNQLTNANIDAVLASLRSDNTLT